jgi:hypothetical protein
MSELIADASSLTRIQVETLKIHLLVARNQINIQQALQSRKNRVVSRGTYYRILAQAKMNVRKSLFTVATAAQLGLLKPEDVQKLLSAVMKIPGDIDEKSLSEVMVLIDAVADRIVMLS